MLSLDESRNANKNSWAAIIHPDTAATAATEIYAVYIVGYNPLWIIAYLF
jgi:hypothetical protein